MALVHRKGVNAFPCVEKRHFRISGTYREPSGSISVIVQQVRPRLIASHAVRELLFNAGWERWAGLGNLLSDLAEASPDEFLKAVESALLQPSSPFDELFSQEEPGFFGRNYLSGLLWALESLAWDKAYLVRVCTILGELANRDPGGNWGNRPSSSLTRILLPWLPQTTASASTRRAAIDEPPKGEYSGRMESSVESYAEPDRNVNADQQSVVERYGARRVGRFRNHGGILGASH